MKGPVVPGSDGQALKSCPGGIRQQGQHLPPCPCLLQHCCKQVWRPAHDAYICNSACSRVMAVLAALHQQHCRPSLNFALLAAAPPQTDKALCTSRIHRHLSLSRLPCCRHTWRSAQHVYTSIWSDWTQQQHYHSSHPGPCILQQCTVTVLITGT